MGYHDTADFWRHLLQETLISLPHYFGKDNWDADRFGPYQRPDYEILFHLYNRITRSGITPSTSDPDSSFSSACRTMQPYLEGYAATYAILNDDYSRTLFVKLIVYRMLGFHKMKLPLSENRDEMERRKDQLRNLVDPSGREKKVGLWTLELMDLAPAGYPVRCYSTRSGILATVLLKQYEYRKGATEISVAPGDCVIDGGGGWGDTALFFSASAGDQGTVFSFEFDPLNIEVFNGNLALNPGLSGRIRIVPRALWNLSGDTVRFSANGPGTTIAQGYEQRSCAKDREVTTLSIDDFVRQEGLARVDFIKMDIEAAELNALKGAKDTILRFRPTLAVAVYHTVADYALIPAYLKGLTENYAFFLDHFTIHHEETVLFAVPREKLERATRPSSGGTP